jgi:hypothetical protein
MMWRPQADHGQKHESGGATALGDLTPDGPLQKWLLSGYGVMAA